MILRLCYFGKLHLPKVITGIFIICVILFLVVFSFAEVLIIKNAVQKPEKNADYIVVLGARVNGTRVTLNLKYRLDVAIDYLNENTRTKVVVSGGQGKGEDVSEAYAMAQYLREHGVKDEQIMLEDQSRTTRENLRFSKAYLEELKTHRLEL